MKCELEINWLFNNCCTFRCRYCHPGSHDNTIAGESDIDKIVNGFNRINKTCLISITGGEPFLNRNFVDLCGRLTEKHVIAIFSNLTCDEVYRFAEVVDPKKVRVFHCGLHIQERESRNLIEDFIKKYKFIESKGFYIFASYVTHPSLLERIEKDYEYFKSRGIILRPQVYKGFDKKLSSSMLKKLGRFRFLFERFYPDAYTQSQKEIISRLIEKSQADGNFLTDHKEDHVKGRVSDVYWDQHFLNGIPTFKGRNCLAGRKFVRMTPQGDVYRCYGEETHLGNLFNGGITLFNEIKECSASYCICPFFAYEYVCCDSGKPYLNQKIYTLDGYKRIKNRLYNLLKKELKNEI